jgi:hypothetical protein
VKIADRDTTIQGMIRQIPIYEDPELHEDPERHKDPELDIELELDIEFDLELFSLDKEVAEKHHDNPPSFQMGTFAFDNIC